MTSAVKIWVMLQIVHLTSKTYAIFVNMNDVADKNVQMTSEVLDSIENVGFIMCARRCEALSMCTGFNFHKTDRICELLPGQPIEKKSREGWRYVNNIEWLKTMSLSIGTENTTCSATDTKLKLSSGARHCRKDFPTDCKDPLINKQKQISGVHKTIHQETRLIVVFCDFEASGGPWTVIQSRVDDSVDFNISWVDYKRGFGKPNGNFWLGNDNLHGILSAGNYRLRIDMEYFDGEKIYAEYSTFNIAGEEDNYRLEISGYSGNAGDGMPQHNEMSFSTKNHDNDYDTRNCAATFTGGWWFNQCFQSNLNGVYYKQPSDIPYEDRNTAIIWSVFRMYDPLKIVTMKVTT